MEAIIRQAVPSDHPRIMAVMPAWWYGRDLRPMLPRLFLDHFHDTSLIAEGREGLAGFLVGFLSASHRNEAYIHFVGVHPLHRKQGLARELYHRFFAICAKHGRDVVRACTSPVNHGSVAFHQRLGFDIEAGDAEVQGVPVALDYNRPGDHKVRFTYRRPPE